MIKRNIFKCEKREMLKQVQHDGSNKSHPETRLSHPEFISGSQENKKILKQVQYDEKKGSHPEFISGSQKSRGMPSPVQHDDYSTGKMPNPAQYNGWRRTSLSLGRSMIEMLGVLAIIGVLSIGGLYAYRQAMESYNLAQTINWIRQIQMIYLDVCVDSNTCPFVDAYDENGNENTGFQTFNRNKLCEFNSQMCSITTPYFKSSTWYFYTRFKNTAGNIALFKLPQSLCRRLTDAPWTSTALIQTQAVFSDGKKEHLEKEGKNGVISAEDKKLLREICDKDADYYNFSIRISNK